MRVVIVGAVAVVVGATDALIFYHVINVRTVGGSLLALAAEASVLTMLLCAPVIAFSGDRPRSLNGDLPWLGFLILLVVVGIGVGTVVDATVDWFMNGVDRNLFPLEAAMVAVLSVPGLLGALAFGSAVRQRTIVKRRQRR